MKALGLLVILMALVGCGKKSSTSTSVGATADGGIAGTWLADSIDQGGTPPNAKSVLFKFTITNTVLNLEQINYDSNTCVAGTENNSAVLTLTYVYDENTQIADGTVTNLYLTFWDVATINMFNDGVNDPDDCLDTNWVVGVQREITNASCGSRNTAAGNIAQYQLVLMDSSTLEYAGVLQLHRQ